VSKIRGANAHRLRPVDPCHPRTCGQSVYLTPTLSLTSPATSTIATTVASLPPLQLDFDRSQPFLYTLLSVDLTLRTRGYLEANHEFPYPHINLSRLASAAGRDGALLRQSCAGRAPEEFGAVSKGCSRPDEARYSCCMDPNTCSSRSLTNSAQDLERQRCGSYKGGGSSVAQCQSTRIGDRQREADGSRCDQRHDQRCKKFQSYDMLCITNKYQVET
jgi:hypothetical protein